MMLPCCLTATSKESENTPIGGGCQSSSYCVDLVLQAKRCSFNFCLAFAKSHVIEGQGVPCVIWFLMNQILSMARTPKI